MNCNLRHPMGLCHPVLLDCIISSIYGVAMTSRLLRITGLFGRIWSLLQGSFAKETYDFKEPTNRRHSILWPYNRILRLCTLSASSVCLFQEHFHIFDRHWQITILPSLYYVMVLRKQFSHCITKIITVFMIDIRNLLFSYFFSWYNDYRAIDCIYQIFESVIEPEC